MCQGPGSVAGGRRRRLLSPVQKYEAFVQVLTGEMNVAERADHWGGDRSTIMRGPRGRQTRRSVRFGVVSAGCAFRGGGS